MDDPPNAIERLPPLVTAFAVGTTLMVIVLAGAVTTHNVVSWCNALLGHYTDRKGRIRAEGQEAFRYAALPHGNQLTKLKRTSKDHTGKSKWEGSVAGVVGLPVDNVWEIAELGGLSRWDQNAIESSDIVSGDGFSEGSIRCVVFKRGDGGRGMHHERLLSYDPENFSYTYSLIENPWGYEGYMATIKLEDRGDGNTFVQWSFELDPMDDAKLEDSVTGAIENVLQRRLSSLDEAMHN